MRVLCVARCCLCLQWAKLGELARRDSSWASLGYREGLIFTLFKKKQQRWCCQHCLGTQRPSSWHRRDGRLPPRCACWKDVHVSGQCAFSGQAGISDSTKSPAPELHPQRGEQPGLPGTGGGSGWGLSGGAAAASPPLSQGNPGGAQTPFGNNFPCFMQLTSAPSTLKCW